MDSVNLRKTMLKASSLPISTKPGRLFEVNPLSETSFKQRHSEARQRLDKAWIILQRIKPNLRKHYCDWYIAIDPDTGVYFLDSTYTGVCLRSHLYFPKTILCIYQLNQSGFVGQK
ncbi:hypothetical protein [Lyngbya sp. PCC 8106]|uniref:hypothetical protein n=1 Tax=Lyngbya sp. (strain PCC 8106) TaxID=313612 RepID=UPI0000EAB628|nr:hypothetical protein [Lyngbya sp. PCC 8106]EAW35962.1 hypothetical protein L8106_22241 [Lyngbya sp. PCC 8106]